MGVKRHVFGSNAERAAYKKLQQRWGDSYSLYSNLPFLMVFDPKNEVSSREFDHLKKTSIDFTLCDDSDKPLVCIEFDGMQDGFNVGTKYRAAEPTDPWRDTIMSLKLKVAHGSLFPYFVVGYREFKDISEAVQVCVVDTLIGTVLADQALRKRAHIFKPEEVGFTEEEFDLLSPIDQDEVIQNWFIGIEVETDFSYNPVFAAADSLYQRLRRQLGSLERAWRYMYQPNTDNKVTPSERARLVDKAILLGAECTVTTQEFGIIRRAVWLPNFSTPGFSAYGFLNELAELVALDALRRLVDTRN